MADAFALMAPKIEVLISPRNRPSKFFQCLSQFTQLRVLSARLSCYSEPHSVLSSLHRLEHFCSILCDQRLAAVTSAQLVRLQCQSCW